jgi:quinol-cytochrome oxidoreductase complex cytochrome b subunit
VIINLFDALPIIGPDLSTWIRGDFVVGDATLNRFFAFHVIAIPLALLGLVGAHIMALHEVGSNNPDGVEIKEHKDANGKPLAGSVKGVSGLDPLAIVAVTGTVTERNDAGMLVVRARKIEIR